MLARRTDAATPSRGTHAGFNANVHGARGLFAFSVFVFHVVNSGLGTFPALATGVGNFIARMSEYGVELFFCISGYVIMGTLRRSEDPLAFIGDRMVRIYPTLWASILVIMGVGMATGTHGFEDLPASHLAWAVPANMLALPGILPLDNVHPAAWSLSYEMAFYLACAACWTMRRKFGTRVRWVAVPAAMAFVIHYPRGALLLAGIVVAGGWPHGGAAARIARHPVPLILLFLACWRMVQELSLPDHIVQTTMLAWSADARLPIALVAVVAATLGFAGITRGHGALGRVLCWGPFQYLGTISYGFYLWHPIVMSGAKAALLRAGIPQAAGIWSQSVFLAVTLPPAIAVAHASQRILERRLADRLRRRLRHTPALIAAPTPAGIGRGTPCPANRTDQSGVVKEGGSIRVSIVIPAFDAEGTIKRALDSARLQGGAELEIIVVDDASTDRTPEIVAQEAVLDHRIRLLSMSANAGPAAARNRGLDAARGEWIALLDADDSYHPGRIGRLLDLANRVGADMVADNVMLHHADGTVPDAPMIPPALLSRSVELTTAEFIARNVGSPEAPRVSYGFLKPMLRTAFLHGKGIAYDERNRFSEDFMLYVDCLTKGARWWLTPEATYQYTIRAGSLTEQQSSGDLMRLRQMEESLLADPRVRVDPSLVQAITRHKAILDRCYYYRAFTDAVKGRDVALAASLLADNGRSAQLIAREAARQLPTILAKALRGGYVAHARR